MRGCLLAIAVLLPATAAAQGADAMLAFSNGHFNEAANLAQAHGDADNYAFAARSLLAKAVSGDVDPDPVVVGQAWKLAEEALAIDPRHVEGRLQLAISMSLTARPMTTRQALRSGYGEKARDLVLSIIEDEPTNAYAHGFLSVWHVEVIRRGGRLGATVMGASVRKGRRHYQAAIAANPTDAALHWQWARVLTALNADKYREEIDATLTAALALPTETALEGIMQSRARTIETAFATLTEKEVEGLAAEML
ncbi:MAG: hypothetical protein AAGJ29_10745 [Pseudomonadota bacterium]